MRGEGSLAGSELFAMGHRLEVMTRSNMAQPPPKKNARLSDETYAKICHALTESHAILETPPAGWNNGRRSADRSCCP
jgi:hypothetical protein